MIEGISHLSEKGDGLILHSSFLITMHLFLSEGLLFRDDFDLSFLIAVQVISWVVVSLLTLCQACLDTMDPNNRYKQAYRYIARLISQSGWV